MREAGFGMAQIAAWFDVSRETIRRRMLGR